MGLEAATKALLDAGEFPKRIHNTQYNHPQLPQASHTTQLRLLSLVIAMATPPAAKYAPFLLLCIAVE